MRCHLTNVQEVLLFPFRYFCFYFCFYFGLKIPKISPKFALSLNFQIASFDFCLSHSSRSIDNHLYSYQLPNFSMYQYEITDNECRPECPWYLSTCRDEVDVIDNEILEVQLSASKPETRAKSGNPGSTWGLTNEAKLSSTTNHLYIPPFGLLSYEKMLRTHLHYYCVSKLSSAPMGIRIQ